MKTEKEIEMMFADLRDLTEIELDAKADLVRAERLYKDCRYKRLNFGESICKYLKETYPSNVEEGQGE